MRCQNIWKGSIIAGLCFLAGCSQQTDPVSKEVAAGATMGVIGGASVGAVGSAAIGATTVTGLSAVAVLGGLTAPKFPPARRLKEAGVDLLEVGEEVILVLPTDCFFKFNSDVLKPERYAILDEITAAVKFYKGVPVTVAGYSDNVGNPRYNLKLSQRRAERVLSYFWQRGVEHERMYAVGFGEQKPVASNMTTRGSAMNRRVEVHLLKRAA